MVIKIVNDELTEILGSDNAEINLNAKAPVLILMVGFKVQVKQHLLVN